MLISDVMASDHKRCDKLFAQTEDALNSGNMEEAKRYWKMFSDETMNHFSIEEDKLFPYFEEATGMTQGPTMVMKIEHTQIKKLLRQIESALDNNSEEQFFGASETLMILLQQHNAKEEQMLYRMIDQHLAPLSEHIVSEIKAMINHE